MMRKPYMKVLCTCAACLLIICFQPSYSSYEHQQLLRSTTQDDIELPPPIELTMSIDEVIQRRTSIREFTEDPLTDEELSTVLWAAYGTRPDGSHTVPMIKDSYASIIYVLREDGIYRYEPVNHSLAFYKAGDYRYIGQYDAPIQLGICWDLTQEDDENISGAEIGEIGQNVYLSCIAMDLGTVATAEIPSPLSTIGLPEEHVGRIVMPIGHPTQETKYLHLPMWISFLP
jgi:nitroreductase